MGHRDLDSHLPTPIKASLFLASFCWAKVVDCKDFFQRGAKGWYKFNFSSPTPTSPNHLAGISLEASSSPPVPRERINSRECVCSHNGAFS